MDKNDNVQLVKVNASRMFNFFYKLEKINDNQQLMINVQIDLGGTTD